MYRKWNQESFKSYIEDKYEHINADNMKFIDVNTSVELFCTKHNIYFTKLPSVMIYNYSSCPLCGKEHYNSKRTSNTEKFIEKCKILYPNNEFDFSKVKYISATDYVIITCNTCHKDFKVTPNNFLRKRKCPNCRIEKFRKSRLLPFSDFVNEANEVQNFRYEYFEDTYVNRNIKTKIYCKKHDFFFWQTPSNHLKGKMCSFCAKESMKETKRMPFSEMVNVCKNIYGENRFIFNESDYTNASTKMKIYCNECNHYFYQYPSLLMKNLVVGCHCNKSIGEFVIEQCLIQEHIEFIPQYKFKDCKDVSQLSFDFYIPSKNLYIEYDGIQHIQPVEFFGGEEGFKITKKHDEIKNDFCLKNNINLLRIPYNRDIEKIKFKLYEYLNNH